MFKKKTEKYFLLGILLIAAILRLYKLGSIPPGLTPDEASLGYNAYSILNTGKDEYGNFLPIIFKSFGDWKPGLYAYLLIPFVAIFGLNEFAVRLPGALSGILSVYLIYLVVNLLFGYGRQVASAKTNKNSQLATLNQKTIALISSFLLAISPWHIHFSRGAWEAGVSLTLTLAGVYFFLMSFKKTHFLLYSVSFFALTLLAYQGAKLSTAIVVLLLVVIYKDKLFKLDKRLLTRSVAVGVLIVSPILLSLFFGKTGRLEVFSIFSYPRPTEYTRAFLEESHIQKGSLVYDLFYSEPLNFYRGIFGRWFNHFSGKFLFFQGDWQNHRHSPPNQGALNLFDIILLPAGFLLLIRKRMNSASKFVLLWLILAPLPAVFSISQVHAVRALNMVIPLTVVSSLGLNAVIGRIYKKYEFRRFKISLIMASVFLAVCYYLDSYFVHLPVHDADLWYYGYKEMVREVARLQDEYETITVRQSYAQPYIYFLFYDVADRKFRYPLRETQTKLKLIQKGPDVGLVPNLENIRFVEFSWPAPGAKGDLIVGGPVHIPYWFENDRFKLIKEIKEPNGNTAFRIVEKE